MKAGGVALYIRSNLVSKESNLSKEVSCEGMICEVGDIGKAGIYIAVFYRAPGCPESEDINMFACIEKLSSKDAIIMGDFNYPGIRWDAFSSDAGGERFLKLVQDCFLFQHILVPTRGDNILDLVFSTEEGMVGDISVEEPLGTGDHSMVFFAFYGLVNGENSIFKSGLNYSKANYKGISDILRIVNWDNEFVGLDTNDMWERFKFYMTDAIKKYIPEFKPKGYQDNRNMWYTKEIDKFRKMKFKCWDKYIKSKLPEDEANFKIALNKFTNEVRKAKMNFEVKLAQEAKSDSKPFFQYVKKNSRTRQGIGKLIGIDGVVGNDDVCKAEILSNHFSSVFNSRSYETKPEVYYMQGNRDTLQEVDFDIDIIRDKLKALKVSKAAGYDNLPAKLLVNTASFIAAPLKLIFDSSLREGWVPCDWKKSNVTPIFKSGDKESPNNYRPVSLTCISCKVIETFIRDTLVSYLTENNIINSNQHGFTKGKSCLTNLLTFLDYVNEYVDQGDPVDVIYLDFSKAFDSVPHELLLYKLDCYGIRGRLLDWIKSWLCGREQRVVLNGESSSWQIVKSGVPQGSVLGPILFTIYINDLGDSILSRLLKFADDTKTFNKICNVHEAEALQRDLDSLHMWADNWGMNFNTEKCKVMHLGGVHNLNYEYRLRDRVLENVDSEKDLGVIVSKDLKVSQQCERASSTANRMLGMIKRTITCRKREVILPLYKSIVRPHLEYCVQAWQPHLIKDIELLEAVQHRATKCITGMLELSYEERLRELKLPSLTYRRIRGDLIEMFKMYKGWSGLKFEEFFTINRTNWLRGHEAKIYKSRFYTNIGKCSFSNRSVELWNRLPSRLLSCTSLNGFKNKLDVVLREEWGYI